MTSGNQPLSKPIRTSPKPTIYPDYCHDISPTILKWCPLRAVDVHALRDVGMFVDEKRLYHYGNHPVKWVRVVGVVVAVDDFIGRKVYTLDDGSGVCIECTCIAPAPPPVSISTVPAHLDQAPRSLATTANLAPAKQIRQDTGKQAEKIPEGVLNPNVPWEVVDVGSVVKVKGRVGAFRDVKQVEVVRVEVVRGTDGEVRHWNEAMVFKRDVLGKDWVVTAEEEAKLRRRRERELRRGRKGDKKMEDKNKDKERDRRKKEDGEGDTARRVLGGQFERKDETGEASRKRKDDEREQHEKIKRRKEVGREGLNPKNRINYPSLAVRRAAAGKYDALGI